MQPLFVSPLEAAQLLGMSRTKVYELVASGELVSRKIGASIKIPRQAITDLCDQLLKGAGAPRNP